MALPGPGGGYFGGATRDFRRDQLGFYEKCAREYGDFVQMKMGPFRILLVYHPDAIEELLVTRNRDFIKSPGVRLLRPLLGGGLLLSEGDTWLRQRRLIQPAFHRQRVAGAVMTQYAERHVDGWRPGQVVDPTLR
jgi:cytochrome P450